MQIGKHGQKDQHKSFMYQDNVVHSFDLLYQRRYCLDKLQHIAQLYCQQKNSELKDKQSHKFQQNFRRKSQVGQDRCSRTIELSYQQSRSKDNSKHKFCCTQTLLVYQGKKAHSDWQNYQQSRGLYILIRMNELSLERSKGWDKLKDINESECKNSKEVDNFVHNFW